jgi:hypothetical protein
MRTLHVRSVPDELCDQITALARASNRSISAQVVTLLDEAVRMQEAGRRQGEILNGIRRRRFVPPPNAPGSVELLREDRRR